MAKLIRDRSTPEQDAWWSAVQDAAKAAPKLTYERSEPMASEDVLERANNFVTEINEADKRRRMTDLGALHLIHALAAEVRELRKDKARLDWLDASFCDGEARIVTVTNIWWRTPGESTCREAIDAAMGGERT